MDTLSTKVPPSMKERIEEYAERIEETRSTAIRELIRAGLDAEESTTSSTPPLLLAQLLGWVMFAGAFVNIEEVVGYLGGAIVLATVLAERLSLIDRLR